MKSRQLFVLLSIIWLGGCSAFFQKASGLDKIQKVAVVSMLLNPTEGGAPISETTDKNLISQGSRFNRQALLESAYTQLQNQIETQLHWQADKDVRNRLPKQLRGTAGEGYETLNGLSFIPASTVYALASGGTPTTATQDYIKELCRQLDVDAVVMVSIDTGQRKKGLLGKLKKERLTPSVLLNLAIVDKQGQVVLNTEHFNETFAERSLPRGTPTSAQVLSAYKVSTNKALEDYFYRSSVIFKRMGYQLSKMKDMTLGDTTKQPAKPSSPAGHSATSQTEKPPVKSIAPLKTTHSAKQPSKIKTLKAPNTTKTISDSKEGKQENSDTKPTRRSIWSLPEEPTK